MEMKKPKQKLNKGMPSAVLLSIAIHAALFFLAGMLVVFTVVKKREVEFEPPKAVERPKMKLKKPKVKIKKTSKPKPTTRIVTKINRASMPDIQLPEMSGMGDGLAGGIGGFDMMPDLSEPTLFGNTLSIGNDFVGNFYDFKHDRAGRDIPHSSAKYFQELRRFVNSGWKESTFARYYRSPRKLYATCFMVPPVLSLLAPEAFGEPDTAGYLWMAHYKGKLQCPISHTNGITFRFWGIADDVMIVRVDGRIVFDGSRANLQNYIGLSWDSDSADSEKFYYGNTPAKVGDWITLEPDASLDMEVLIGEVPGGVFCSMLAVEEQGAEYPKGSQLNPILPMFKTSVPSLDLVDAIHENLPFGEVCVTNGPVFSDFGISGVAITAKSEPAALPVFSESLQNETRTWIGEEGKSLEGKLVTVIGDKVVLTDSHGRHRKIPVARFSEEDREYIELARPPKFNIDFSKKSSQRFFKESPIQPGAIPKHLDYVFSTRLKQVSAGKYNHELKVEFFAIGEEISGDNYILLDRQESSFTPTKANERSHTFSGDPIPLRDFVLFDIRRGKKYGGYLVLVRDSRGVIVDYGTSHKWLLGIVDKLRRLPVGSYFDKTGTRVGPTRPKPPDYSR